MKRNARRLLHARGMSLSLSVGMMGGFRVSVTINVNLPNVAGTTYGPTTTLAAGYAQDMGVLDTYAEGGVGTYTGVGVSVAIDMDVANPATVKTCLYMESGNNFSGTPDANYTVNALINSVKTTIPASNFKPWTFGPIQSGDHVRLSRNSAGFVVSLVRGGTVLENHPYTNANIASAGVVPRTQFVGLIPIGQNDGRNYIFLSGVAPALTINSATPQIGRSAILQVTYSGFPGTAGYQYQVNGTGPFADAVTTANPSTGTATILIPALSIGLVGTDVSITLQQKNLPSVTASTSVYLAAPMVLGVNDDFAISSYLNQGRFSQWLRQDNYGVVYDRGLKASGVDVESSATGAGSTIRRDLDGRFYGTNGLGLTTIALATRSFGLTGTNAYYYQLAPGLTFNAAAGTTSVTGNSYNSTTGMYTFTTTAADGGVILYINISSLPVGGMATPDLWLQSYGATPPGVHAMNPTAAANVTALGTRVRSMNTNGTNIADDHPTRTTTALPVRTMANRVTLPGQYDSFEDTVARANASGSNLHWNAWLIDGDAYITAAADYIAANLTAGKTCDVELCNEAPWNFIFNASGDTRLAGVRRGYGPAAANPSALTPETIIDCGNSGAATVLVSNAGAGNWTTQVAFAAGDKIMVNTQVYTVVGAQISGTTFPATGNASFTILYDYTACTNAAFRYLASRTKEIGVIFKARFAAVSRTAPKMVLSSQSGSTIGSLPAGLDWDNNYLAIDHVSFAPYYGGGQYGYTIGDYGDATSAPYRDVLGASGVAAAATAYFNTSPSIISATVSGAGQFAASLRQYCVSKGLAGNAITPVIYECGWHWITAGAWPSAPLVNSLFQTIVLDSRQGRDYTQYLQGLQASGAAVKAYVFDRIGPAITSGGYWALMQTEADNTAANYRFTAVKNFAATL